MWLPAAFFFALFYLYPLARILGYSFTAPTAGAAGSPLAAVMSPSATRALWFSFWQASLSTLMTLAVGLPGAYVLARYRFPGKAALRTLLAVPFVLPTVVVAAAFRALLGSSGGLLAVVIAHVFFNTTLVVRLVGDAWAVLHPRLEESAATLGASPWRRWWSVTLPRLRPSIAAAATLVFVFNFTSFGTVLLLGGGRYATLEVEIYLLTTGLFDLSGAALLALLQLLVTAMLAAVYMRIVGRRNSSERLTPAALVQRTPQGWRETCLVVGVVVGLAIWLATPQLLLLLRGVFAWTDGAPRWLLVQRLQLAPRGAVANSLLFAAATALITLALAVPSSIAASRETTHLSPLVRFAARAAEIATLLPLGTSAVTIGLGFILALGLGGFDLRASPVLIPIAHSLVAFPLVFRVLVVSLRTQPPALREASSTLGATPGATFRRLELPLSGRAMAAGGLFGFAISLGEFGATALISRPELPTMTTAIFRALSRPGAANYGQGMALSALLLCVTAASVIVIESLREGTQREF